MSELSRRSLVTTAAALPALVVPAVAANDNTAELLRLADEVKAAWEQLGDACDALGVAEAKVSKWRKSNPLPDDDAGFTMWEAACKRECDYTEAKAAEEAASDKLSDAIDALCRTPARTIRGLVVKARATKIDEGGMFDGLRQSIIDNLLALDAGADAA
jgi:hypothetical protein